MRSKLIAVISLVVEILVVTLLLILISLNMIVVLLSSPSILSVEEINSDYEAIVVLGCGVFYDTPSPLLVDRLDKAIELYKSGKSSTLILSGDSQDEDDYDEVGVMADYVISKGIPSEDIIMDKLGLSTYDSCYRIINIYGLHRIIVITSDYHIYRSVYCARGLGIDAIGVKADNNAFTEMKYPSSNSYNQIRELLARAGYVYYGLIGKSMNIS